MRIFGSERISGLMLRLGMEEGVPIEHGMVTKSIERAQKQVEAQNFSIRKHLLEYDDVMNKQRKAVYDMRRMILEGKNTREHLLTLVDEIVDWYADNYCNEKDSVSSWSYESLQGALKETFGLELQLDDLARIPRSELVPKLAGMAQAALRGARAADRRRAGALPPAHDHAADRRHAVEGPPVLARPPEGGHRAARLRAARPARRVQEGILPDVPGADGPDRRGDPALDLPVSARGDAGDGGRGRRDGGAARPPGARARAASPSWPSPASGPPPRAR